MTCLKRKKMLFSKGDPLPVADSDAFRVSFTWGRKLILNSMRPGVYAPVNYVNIGSDNGPFARYVKFRVAHAPGMPGTFSPPPRVSNPDMHHGRCATHVPWYMPGSLTVSFEVGGGENVPGIPSACTTRNFTYLARGPWLVVWSRPLSKPV